MNDLIVHHGNGDFTVIPEDLLKKVQKSKEWSTSELHTRFAGSLKLLKDIPKDILEAMNRK
jgi:hypothetical protein